MGAFDHGKFGVSNRLRVGATAREVENLDRISRLCYEGKEEGGEKDGSKRHL